MVSSYFPHKTDDLFIHRPQKMIPYFSHPPPIIATPSYPLPAFQVMVYSVPFVKFISLVGPPPPPLVTPLPYWQTPVVQ